MASTNIQLYPGFIIYVNSYALNDFESMPVGTCTNLTGWLFIGNATTSPTIFFQR